MRACVERLCVLFFHYQVLLDSRFDGYYRDRLSFYNWAELGQSVDISLDNEITIPFNPVTQ